MKRRLNGFIVVLAAVGLIAGTTVWYIRQSNGQTPAYRTAEATRGDLLVTIGATGTVEPEEVVDVGAQVAGQIVSFGRDVAGKTVDYGSVVEEGTVLARIDDSLYSADVAQAEAQVKAAKASLQRSEADLEQLKAKLQQADRDWRRAQKIGPSGALAQTSYDAYRTGYETAKANVAVGQAAILQAQAGLAQAEAGLGRAQRNLGYCTIKSPVKGVIIDRRVNIGQTVVSSLNAPSLFLIAKDLKRMQVWVAVNEADIGKIRPGQPVSFTVDAFPGETFHGEVGKVRLNASMTQNVVTYTVEIVADNSSGRLLPYLTANVQFELNRLHSVLQVPNAALRWTPASVEQVAPEFRDAFARPSRGQSGRKASFAGESAAGEGAGNRIVWALDGSYVRPIPVKAGVTDGQKTEVEGKGLAEGQKVVTGLEPRNGERRSASNPFTPQFLRRDRNKAR